MIIIDSSTLQKIGESDFVTGEIDGSSRTFSVDEAVNMLRAQVDEANLQIAELSNLAEGEHTAIQRAVLAGESSTEERQALQSVYEDIAGHQAVVKDSEASIESLHFSIDQREAKTISDQITAGIDALLAPLEIPQELTDAII